jgi:ketosteroid isomerase-like protein
MKWTMSLLAVVVLAACERGAAESDRPAGPDPALADTLRALVEDAYDFSRGDDVVAGMTSLYPDTGRIVSASDGFLMSDADSVRQGIVRFWENVGRNMVDPQWQWGEVHVDRLGRDAAVMTATWSIPHTAPTGLPHVIRGAWTAVFVRLDGTWKIVQEHLSIPPES